ncbi:MULTISPECIES: Na/Pi symporter [unclassified Isoptericola]|uniref:Na/Pi symporter n=1 Tax=unclassified Isoptericola TaxID=2623355 RepID=UPI0027131C62|nr:MULTISPECIES: Na/Pi symporter [unclassified Isoptericola]MDO8143053.1 Na/Pi symporter [Isoptericola sp. 178]MDO8146914.1 Na/Pi symporter [Isoptericola sp. b515]
MTDVVPQASVTTANTSQVEPKRLRSPFERFGLTGRPLRTVNWLGVVAGVYVLITAVELIGSGFKAATGDTAESLFAFASNPFVALMVGVLFTAATQSSSTTTSVTVGLVAGGLPIQIAIPMLMGANIGTTLTNTLVSLGMVRDRESFRRAFSAATVHDFFNLLAVAIFLPLELAFGLLERVSGWLAGASSGADGGIVATLFAAIGTVVDTVTEPLANLLEAGTSFLPDPWHGVLMIVLGIGLILGVINWLGRLLKVLMVGKAAQMLHSSVGRGPISGVASGAAVTMMVQSSSTTTSLMIPLAGSGTFSLKQVYPFTVGANIGTTVTALIAAFAFTGAEGEVALQAAFVHVMFNVFAALVIFGMPLLRQVPLRGAVWLGNVAAANKLWAAAWVLGVFVGVPMALIGLTVLL